MKKLKVGFLIDELKVSHYVYELIHHVNQGEHFCEPVLIHGYAKKTDLNFLTKIKSIFSLGLINAIRRIVFAILARLIRKIEIGQTIKQYPNFLKVINLIGDLHYKEILVKGMWSKSELYLDFTDSDIELLQNEEFDCIIRNGNGILIGEILNIAKFGVLSFHHGNNRVNRGGPSGFWEVFYNQPSSGFIIQKLTKELDGGEVLVRGNIMTLGTWTSNNAQLFEKSNFFLKDVLDKIAKSRSWPKVEGPRLHGDKLLKLNSSKILLIYLFRVIVPLIFKKLFNIILSENVTRWSVAYSKHDNFQKSLWRYKEIENPSGRFLADPFVISYQGKSVVFVEDLFYSDNKGRISAVQINENSEEFLGVVLEEDFHLSFPFVFEEKGSIYMIPESVEAKDIRLYKCIEFPTKWALEKTLMENISAADTMVIKQDNLWFMLTNICSAGIGDYQSELHIFFSNKFDSTHWEPIEGGNPVIFDSLTARNGGLFYRNGDVYRVNQIQGKSHYGKSFGVNKVLHLSTSEYLEERVSTINANYKAELYSTHHFNANSEFAVVDFCRLERIKNI